MLYVAMKILKKYIITTVLGINDNIVLPWSMSLDMTGIQTIIIKNTQASHDFTDIFIIA